MNPFDEIRMACCPSGYEPDDIPIEAIKYALRRLETVDKQAWIAFRLSMGFQGHLYGIDGIHRELNRLRTKGSYPIPRTIVKLDVFFATNFIRRHIRKYIRRQRRTRFFGWWRP